MLLNVSFLSNIHIKREYSSHLLEIMTKQTLDVWNVFQSKYGQTPPLTPCAIWRTSFKCFVSPLFLSMIMKNWICTFQVFCLTKDWRLITWLSQYSKMSLWVFSNTQIDVSMFWIYQTLCSLVSALNWSHNRSLFQIKGVLSLKLEHLKSFNRISSNCNDSIFSWPDCLFIGCVWCLRKIKVILFLACQKLNFDHVSFRYK